MIPSDSASAFAKVIAEEEVGWKRDSAIGTWMLANITEFADLGRRPTEAEIAKEEARLFPKDPDA